MKFAKKYSTRTNNGFSPSCRAENLGQYVASHGPHFHRLSHSVGGTLTLETLHELTNLRQLRRVVLVVVVAFARGKARTSLRPGLEEHLEKRSPSRLERDRYRVNAE